MEHRIHHSTSMPSSTLVSGASVAGTAVAVAVPAMRPRIWLALADGVIDTELCQTFSFDKVDRVARNSALLLCGNLDRYGDIGSGSGADPRSLWPGSTRGVDGGQQVQAQSPNARPTATAAASARLPDLDGGNHPVDVRGCTARGVALDADGAGRIKSHETEGSRAVVRVRVVRAQPLRRVGSVRRVHDRVAVNRCPTPDVGLETDLIPARWDSRNLDLPMVRVDRR